MLLSLPLEEARYAPSHILCRHFNCAEIGKKTKVGGGGGGGGRGRTTIFRVYKGRNLKSNIFQREEP